MNTSLVIMAVSVGLANWAFRAAPTKLDLARLKPGGLLNGFLESMGPAAIATLLVSAILPMVGGNIREMTALVLGLASVVALFYWKRNVIIATFGGAVFYAAILVIAG